MNTALLRRVAHHINEQPERFCAAEWAWARNVQAVLHDGAAPDQFRCCIAGHVLLLSKRLTTHALLQHSVQYDDGHLARMAADVADLTDAQRNELFYPALWEDPLRSRYYLTATRADEAKICAQYVAYFVDKHTADAAPDRGAVERQAPVHADATLATR
jgi:hypothetical protein